MEERDLQVDFRGEGAPIHVLRDAGRSQDRGTIGPITPCEHRAECTDKPQPWSHLEAEALDKLGCKLYQMRICIW